MEPFTEKHLDALRKEYGTLEKVDPCGETYPRLKKFLENLPITHLQQLRDAKIKFISILAGTLVNQREEKLKADLKQLIEDHAK